MPKKNNVTDIADALVEESLKEAADTFFSKRSGLEQEIESFYSKVDQLKQVGRVVQAYADAIENLLLTKENVEAFYKKINVDQPEIIENNQNVKIDVDVPFAITPLGRYLKLFYKLYNSYNEKVEEYYDGRYYDDPNVEGRKLKTVNYEFIKSWLKELNIKINEINKYTSTSEYLRFIKKFDVESEEKERITEATFDIPSNREEDFETIDFSSLGLGEFHFLPELKEVKSIVKQYCKNLYKEHREEIKRAISTVKKKFN